MTHPATPSQTWWSASEIAEAGLPDMPDTKRGVNDLAKREGWALQPGKARRRAGRGGGMEYHVSLFPIRAKTALMQVPKAPEGPRPREEVWAEFEGLKDSAKAKAEIRLNALREIDDLQGIGLTRTEAVRAVSTQINTSEKTIWNWLALVEGVAREDRLAYLAPRVGGSAGEKVEIDENFLAFLKDQYLRGAGPKESAPSFAHCYRETSKIAAKNGWPIPAEHIARRRLDAAVPDLVRVLKREGSDALRRLYPYQERDKSGMRAMEVVQGDFHTHDTFVHWPGFKDPIRPLGFYLSDVYSGKVLAYRLSDSANSFTVQLTIGDMIRQYGIPERMLLDNGRENAAKIITGGAPNRFRFKVKDDELPGLLPSLDIQIMWATPYSGQSKPIERYFRSLEGDTGRHIVARGTYTGPSPDFKPEAYGSRAMSYEDFKLLVAVTVEEQNARTGRKSPVANNRSFDQVFAESYKAGPIRKATEAQQRLWLLSAEVQTANRDNGELKLLGNRFWNEWLVSHAGAKVTVRFDPEDVQAGLHVYNMAGQYLGHADCIDKGGFTDTEAGRVHNRKRKAFTKAVRQMAEAERTFTDAEMERMWRSALDLPKDAELPQADVIRLMPGERRATSSTAPDAEATPSNVTSLSDRRGPAPISEDDAIFERALELLETRDRGQPLTVEQAEFLDEYIQSPAYRSRMKLRAMFGED